MIQRVQVYGMKWTWAYEMEGHPSIDELWLRPGLVRLDLTSRDVRHNFRVEGFGLDAVVSPGETTTVYLQVIGKGETRTAPDKTCPPERPTAECMYSRVLVVDDDGYAARIRALSGPAEGKSWAYFGSKVYADNGCAACHGELEEGGSAPVGPQLYGVAGSMRKVTGKGEVLADKAYLERALLQPTAEVSEGFAPTQPSYAGQLTDGQVRALVELLQCKVNEPPTDLDCTGLD